DSAVEQILVAADSRSLFTTDQDGDLYIWDAAGGKPPRRIVGGAQQGVVASPDGRFLAWAVPDDSEPAPGPAHPDAVPIGSRTQLYDVATNRFIGRLPGVKDDARVHAVLQGGKTVLTLDRAATTVRLWDVESGKERRSFPTSSTSDWAHLAPALRV